MDGWVEGKLLRTGLDEVGGALDSDFVFGRFCVHTVFGHVFCCVSDVLANLIHVFTLAGRRCGNSLASEKVLPTP